MSVEPNKNCHPLYRIEPIKPWFIQEGDGDGEGGDTGDGSDGGDSGAPAAKGEPAAKEPPDKQQSKMSEEEAKLLKDVMKWKEKARSLESTQTELQSKVSNLTDLQGQLDTIKKTIGDVELDDLKGLIDAKKQAETKAMEDKGQYDQIVEQMKTEHSSRVDGLNEKLGGMNSELDAAKEQIKSLTVGRAFSDSGFIRDRSVLTSNIAMKEFGDYFDYTKEGVVAYNKPRGIEGRAPIVDADGNKQPFDAAIEKLYSAHPDSASLIKSTQKPGAGSKSEELNGAGKKQPTEQLRGIDKIGAGLRALG